MQQRSDVVKIILVPTDSPSHLSSFVSVFVDESHIVVCNACHIDQGLYSRGYTLVENTSPTLHQTKDFGSHIRFATFDFCLAVADLGM